MSKGQIEYKNNAAEFILEPNTFDKQSTKARCFSGSGDVLVMDVGQKTGPWKVEEIRKDQVLDKRYKPVDVIIASCKGRRMRMPAATSFRSKVEQAELDVGSVFLLERGPDYRANGKDCEGYSLYVLD